VIAKVHVVWSRAEAMCFAFGLSFLSDSPAQRRAIARMRAHIARRKRGQKEAAAHA
jgi:hypothetical protein